MTEDEELRPFVAFRQSADDYDLNLGTREGEGILQPSAPGLLDAIEQYVHDQDEEPGTEAQRRQREIEEGDEQRLPEDEDEERVAIFQELNQADKKVPWKERYEVIKRQFPSVESLKWKEVFRQDPTIMGRILNDIIKVEVAPKGRPGKRPPLDRGQAGEIFQRYKGNDYALVEFPSAVNHLKQSMSIRTFARKCSMSPAHAYRLMTGYREPTIEDMEMIAQACGKHPSYFHEWRMAYVCRLFIERGDQVPEAGIVLYNKAIEARKELP